MDFNAITEHTNMQCTENGVTLTGFVVDDGARHWVWARDAEDAKDVVMEAHGFKSYEDDVGIPRADVWTCPLTHETLAGITCRCDDEGTIPMADAMMASPNRGLVACSEW